MATTAKTKTSTSTGKSVGRERKSGRYVEIGGASVRVATPVTSLPTKKQSEIRVAVRGYYAGKKGK